MTIRKSGKCVICQKVVIETKTFDVTIDMFEPDAEVRISGDLADRIKEWRDADVHCSDHI